MIMIEDFKCPVCNGKSYTETRNNFYPYLHQSLCPISACSSGIITLPDSYTMFNLLGYYELYKISKQNSI